MPLVQTPRIERAEQREIERVRLGDAAHLALEVEAVVAVASLPALLGLLGDGIEPRGDEVGGGVGLLGRLHEACVERAGDGRLLDDAVRIARMQAVDERDDAARLVDDGAQILACPLLARAGDQHRLFEAGVDQEVLQRGLVLEVRFRLAARHLVERRLGDEHVALLHQLHHLPVEERQQQRADVGAVDVGVGHDDDLVVAQLRDIEVVADAGAERGDDVGHLLGRQHLVDARALDVEDLAADRQHGLELALAALLGGAAGRVAFDDEKLGVGRVAVLALGETARKPQVVERALTPRQLARLARRLAGERRLDDLADDGLGFLG